MLLRGSAPQKPYRPSPVQDSKQRGSGGLLSQLTVHATRRDGEDLKTAQCSRTGGKWCCGVCLMERSDLSYVGTEHGGEQAA